MNINKFDILKDYCEWGWRLLPVDPQEKRPLIKKWGENATCDHQTIEHWSTKAFKWANWGIVCGKESGIIVIDLDEPKPDKDGNIHDIHGEVALPLLEQELGKLPVTVSQTTPGNGRHLFFKAPQDMTIHVEHGIRFFPGMAIDILSEKRQVIVSPSKRPDGYYEWVPGLSPWDIPLAELPQAWIERLSRKRHTSSTKKDTVISLSTVSQNKFTLPDEIGNGERNDTLFKYACSLLAKGESPDRVRELVLKADAERGNPPMQDDHKDYQELLNTIESAIKTDEAGRLSKIAHALDLAGMDYTQEEAKKALDWLIIIPKKDGTVTYDINEPVFATYFVEEWYLTNVQNMIYSVETGEYMNDTKISQAIYNEIRPYITKGTASRVKSLLELVKIHAYDEFEMPDEFTITLKDRAFKVERDGTFTDIPHERTLFSFPITYDKDAKCPKWEAYINGLIPQHAIRTLQQYMGYLFIPSKSAQVSLFLIGRGGEGKSVLFKILIAMMGEHNIVKEQLHTLFNPDQRFQTAQLVNRYVNIDDDMNTAPLKETGDFKRWVTDDITQIEPKNVQRYQVKQFTRFISAGNKMLTAKYDSTDAWYRRLVQINVLPKPEDRVNNVFLKDELMEELSGIFNWCMDGLSDFMKCGCQLYQSEEIKETQAEEKYENDVLEVFLNECDLITLDPEAWVSGEDLFQTYRKWAMMNGYYLFNNAKALTTALKPKAKYGIETSKLGKGENRGKRGIQGIRVHYEKKDYNNYLIQLK